MRRSQGAVLGAVYEALNDAGEGETVRLDDITGLVADGAPLTAKDAGNAMRYMTRVVGVTKKTGRGEWQIISLAAINRARDKAAWFEDADIESTWVTECRRLNAGRYRRCSSCGITLGLQQNECDLCT